MSSLAPNRQAEQSLDEQSIIVPADVRPHAIASPASIFLARLEGGDFMMEVNEKIREVAAASYNFTKKGKITLELEFKPSGARKMDIKAKIKASIPQEERSPTTTFVTPDGQLPVHDPDQQVMPLRVVKTHSADAKITRSSQRDRASGEVGRCRSAAARARGERQCRPCGDRCASRARLCPARAANKAHL